MLDSQLLAFSLIAAILTITPGVDTFLVLRNVLRGGRKDGFVTTLGICSGLFVHVLFSAIGLSIILAQSATAFSILKLVGAIYLCWIGLQSLRSAFSKEENGMNLKSQETDVQVKLRKSFGEGFLTNILNPKVAIFYLAFLPQFISPGDPVLAKSVLLTFIHYVMGVIWLGTLAVLIDRTRHWVTNPKVRHWVEGISGTMLVLFGIKLAFEKS